MHLQARTWPESVVGILGAKIPVMQRGALIALSLAALVVLFSTVAGALTNPIHLLALVAVLAFWIGPAFLVARVADRKGRSFAAYLIASLMIWWPIPLLIALVVPRRQVG